MFYNGKSYAPCPLAAWGIGVVLKRLKPILKPKNIMPVKHIHEIKLKGKGNFAEKFNHCSDLFQKAMDKTLNDAERDKYWAEYISERQRIEFGL